VNRKKGRKKVSEYQERERERKRERKDSRFFQYKKHKYYILRTT